MARLSRLSAFLIASALILLLSSASYLKRDSLNSYASALKYTYAPDYSINDQADARASEKESNVSLESLSLEERLKFISKHRSADILEPKGKQIAVLTATDGKGHNGGISNLLKMAEENRREYCEYHDYVYQFINISKYDLQGRQPVWAKLPAIQEVFDMHPQVEWVWWLDTDAIVMSPYRDLGSYLLNPDVLKKKVLLGERIKKTDIRTPADIDIDAISIVISQDHNGFNAGSILFKRNDFTMLFLDLWSDFKFISDAPGQEQDVFAHIYLTHSTFRDYIALVPQRAINSYFEGGPQMSWQKGDLAAHLAGCWVENKCNERWSSLWNKRERVLQ
ncbi:galactosyl transferase GMA12/MNN10 family-domain-containing protein [Dipodascopsis uninucleata]